MLAGWTELLETNVSEAQRQGNLAPASRPHQLIFEINATLDEANGRYLLFWEAAALQRARRAIKERLAYAHA